MHIAPMSDDDVARVVSAWNLALPHDQVSVERFRSVMLEDPNYEPEGVLTAQADDGSLLGFSACALRRTVSGKDGRGTEWVFGWGFLKGFFVVECDREDEVAGSLLERAEAYCREAGKAELRVTEYAGAYVFPGIDVRCQRLRDMLARHGYRDVRTIEDVAVDLRDLALSSRLEQARQRQERLGKTVLAWHPELLPAMQRFVAQGDQPQWFPPGWESQYREPDETTLVLRGGEHLSGQEIMGWAHYWPGRPRAGFGPILVLERDRGQGYGSLLLLECMMRARAQGAEVMTAGWANTGFYTANGWHITRRYAVLTKDLGG